VARLSGAGWLRPLPGSSPTELTQQLVGSLPPAAGPFDELTERYQAVWYGAAPLDEAASDRVRQHAEQVVAASLAAGPAPRRTGRGSTGEAADPDDGTDRELDGDVGDDHDDAGARPGGPG
jgi:hypothetical protein